MMRRPKFTRDEKEMLRSYWIGSSLLDKLQDHSHEVRHHHTQIRRPSNAGVSCSLHISFCLCVWLLLILYMYSRALTRVIH